MNQSELQSVWTRILDGETLSGPELAALNAFLKSADSQDSRWLTDDISTDELLRVSYAQDVAESMDASASSQFVQRVKQRIAEQSRPAPAVDAPPIVTAPPIVVRPLDPSGQSRRRSRPMSRWILAATAASILLVGATAIALLSDRKMSDDQASAAHQQPTPIVPQRSERFADSSREGTPTSIENRLTPESPAEKQVDVAGQVETLPTADESPGQIASNRSSNEAGDDGMPHPNRAASPPASPTIALVDSAGPESYALAAVVHSDKAVWVEGYGSPSDLPAGPLVLESGQVQLRMAQGTELTLSGPTKVELIDGNRISLTAGLIAAHVPEVAIGFEVQAPGGRVVDLGTRFTVDADPDQNYTVVKVIEGTVEVIQPAVNPRGRERKTRLTAGRMKWLPFDGKQTFDWCLVAEFGDETINPGLFTINGEAFDVRFLDESERAKVRVAEWFQEASVQCDLVPRGERFSALLVLDDVPQILTTEDQLDMVQASLVERVEQRQKLYFLPRTPEEMLNEIQNRLRSSIGNPSR